MRASKGADLAATYERISDDREGRELGVERQRKDNRAAGKREGLTIVSAVYADNDLSASTKSKKERPAYQRLLADARAGHFKVIIAYSASRLTRRPREHEDLIELAQQHGIRFLFVRSPSFDLNTADGRQVARMLAAADAAEAERTQERVARAVGDRAERGEFHGGPRGYGLESDGRTIREDEAVRIRAWAAHILAGGSLRTLATELNAARVTTVRGTAWRGEVIRKILLAPRIAGLRVHNGVEYPSWSPAIVSPATWRALRVLLGSPERRAHDAGTARKWLGTGLFICQRCTPATVKCDYTRGIRKYRCPRCYRTWNAEPIDHWIAGEDGLMEMVLREEDRRGRLLPRPPAGADSVALESEAAAIRVNMAEAAAAFVLAKGATRAALQQGMAAGERRLAEIEAEVVGAGGVDPLAELFSDDPVATWRATNDLHRRQVMISRLMTVTLGPPIRGRAAWDPEQFIQVEPA